MALVTDTPVLAQWCARCPDVTFCLSIVHPSTKSNSFSKESRVDSIMMVRMGRKEREKDVVMMGR